MPSCGKITVDNWVNDITKDILEVPHLHITLTTDDFFRPFFYNDRDLLKVLLIVGAQAVQKVVDDLLPGIRIGMVYTTHTFGRGLGFKPHVHLVITKGGQIKEQWVEIDRVPGAKLSATWRYLLCRRLREVMPTDTNLQRVIAKTYQEHRGFVVCTESFYPKGIDAARYIGRYLGHPPLVTSHLTDYDGHHVTFWFKETDTGEKRVVHCSALEFISHMVPHIPPKGLQLIRYSGLYARCIKRRLADVAHKALDAIQMQIPLLVLEPLAKCVPPLKWRERIESQFRIRPPRMP